MKNKINKILILFLGLTTLINCSTDLSDKEQRLDDHESRLNSIEKTIKSENLEISKISKIIELQSSNLYVKSHTKTKDGYQLVLSDDSIIELSNQSTPLMGVKKHTDEVLYWTINGKFMLDSKSKKVRAEPKNTKIEHTEIRVNTENEWEFSKDGGNKWEKVLGADGYPLMATGKNGVNGKDGEDGKDLELTIEENEDFIDLNYNGVIYKIPTKQQQRQESVKTPLAYLAEYNVNVVGDGFATSHKNAATGHFNWYQLKGITNDKHNTNGINIIDKNVFKEYHAPNHKEWRSIVPDLAVSWETGSTNSIGISEEITITGTTETYTADYDIETKYQTCYALRFKGNDNKFLSAYKYEYVDSEFDSGKMMRITAILLGKDKANISITDISKESFWNKSKEEQVVRILPTSGYVKNGDIKRSGEQGFYLSTDLHPTHGKSHDIIMSMNFYETYMQCTVDAYGNYTNDQYAIRLFMNKK